MRRMPHPRSEILVAAAAVMMVTAPARAGLTSITYTPNPLVLGSSATYTANDDSTWYPRSYSWRYRCTNGGTPGNWVNAGGSGNTLTIIESVPGGYEVQCTVTYGSNSGGGQPPAPSSVSVDVTINPANADQVAGGLNVNTAVGSQGQGIQPGNLTVTFQPLSGSTPIGGYISGTLQERIRRPDQNFDSGWTNGDPNSLYLQGGRIIDIKTLTLQPPSTMADYNNLPNGYILDDFYQQNRIIMTDSCGNSITMNLTEHHFRKVKTGPGVWALVEQ